MFHKSRRSYSKKKLNGKLKDDSFSNGLKEQGSDGKFMRQLYLRPWTDIYQKRVLDESIHSR